ncbi:hypothetical protein PCANC_12593 [Puccinia coronata f. sp. avenae]|uniref:J domain-containing protein n=1 Tax=Puccinia coronata f. sp. avenae TaxID=200324 RepID=A0A2N5UMX4_9BASI|nr:hypothetical protein PCASD_15818 [Puccinia coronata f. sp. avenae]PLW39114.1 hypothetical protein PCANC_12593 [Puccinia coronata f. sp. avenae]
MPSGSSSLDQPANVAVTASKRLLEESPHHNKSTKLDYMKSKICVEPEVIKLLEGQSQLAYYHFSVGNYQTSIGLYKKFLDGRSRCSDYINECGELPVMQAILNLVRSYLALCQFPEAQVALEALWHPKSSMAISASHSIYGEVANLYSQIKEGLVSKASSDAESDHENMGLFRSLKSIQRRAQIEATSGRYEKAVQLIQQNLELFNTSINSCQLGDILKELLVELHLSLAEGCLILKRYSDCQVVLEKLWHPKEKLFITATHKLFKNLAKLYSDLKIILLDEKVEAAATTTEGSSPYQILMVSSNATTEEIRAAYRKLAFIHHPDRKGSTQSMQRIVAAYQTLNDPTQKEKYDQLHSPKKK